MPSKKSPLGRGLDALLPVASTSIDSLGPTDENFRRLPIDQLTPNPQQPRQTFDEAALEELAASIKAHGLIQPLAATCKQGKYYLVAGERRWRAAKLAGLEEVPVIILKTTEQQMLEFALVENLVRSDLNPMEEARAYRALTETFALSHEQVAERVGRSRVSVTNMLRLLKLESPYQHDLETGVLSPGHGRALLSLSRPEDRRKLREGIVQHGWTVRQTEQAAAKLAEKSTKKRPVSRGLDANQKWLKESLTETLGCRVEIRAKSKNRGCLEIWYDSPDDLERFLGLVGLES
jgi:ParB family chromosome partitioning protein